MPNYVPLSAQEFEELHRLLSAVLSTRNVPVVIPGEAILGIEAIAAGIAAPGRKILNIVTGPYGTIFGNWLARGGAEVVNVQSSFDDVASVEAVAEAIENHLPSALSFVQAEAATGGSNPTRRILELARRSGLVTVIDAVSAIGAEPVPTDEWGIDFVAVGAQKGLAGPNGISAVGISDRGWEFLESNPGAPRDSILSLLDLRRPKADPYAGRIPPNIPVLEARALIEALRRIEQDGLPAVNRRHRLASSAAIAGIRALGLEPWQRSEASYSPLVTTVRLPGGGGLRLDRPEGIVAPGDGALNGKLLRINHFGANAGREAVEQAIVTLAGLARRDPKEAIAAAGAVWEAEHGR
ncbi:alanine--glyoxylate aminotransferase family protein [Cohnella xylanilytica]|uniref:Alanine--glyoxylate aminotransferase family protein n=1 Tax=Cohnella xylanilytica TaxID=557555 RepID=A0A841U3X8_9BACL|nr:aminotransferase class V-fold PLP-dependent enzyme [Cohnella xylanilytica]MBB6695275.1 alanine--glyoxylate aminotransferase family protein [Cohnella xylanilytica]